MLIGIRPCVVDHRVMAPLLQLWTCFWWPSKFYSYCTLECHFIRLMATCYKTFFAAICSNFACKDLSAKSALSRQASSLRLTQKLGLNNTKVSAKYNHASLFIKNVNYTTKCLLYWALVSLSKINWESSNDWMGGKRHNVQRQTDLNESCFIILA